MTTDQERLVKSFEYLATATSEGKYGENNDIDWETLNEEVDNLIDEAGPDVDEEYF